MDNEKTRYNFGCEKAAVLEAARQVLAAEFEQSRMRVLCCSVEKQTWAEGPPERACRWSVFSGEVLVGPRRIRKFRVDVDLGRMCGANRKVSLVPMYAEGRLFTRSGEGGKDFAYTFRTEPSGFFKPVAVLSERRHIKPKRSARKIRVQPGDVVALTPKIKLG